MCVCVYLTDVDSSAVALHEHQHKDMQRDQVDDEDVASPCWHLQAHTENQCQLFLTYVVIVVAENKIKKKKKINKMYLLILYTYIWKK